MDVQDRECFINHSFLLDFVMALRSNQCDDNVYREVPGFQDRTFEVAEPNKLDLPRAYALRNSLLQGRKREHTPKQENN